MTFLKENFSQVTGFLRESQHSGLRIGRSSIAGSAGYWQENRAKTKRPRQTPDQGLICAICSEQVFLKPHSCVGIIKEFSQ
jgi:hypothetical protein